MNLCSNVSDKDNTRTTEVSLEIDFGENSMSHLLVDMTSKWGCIFNNPFESSNSSWIPSVSTLAEILSSKEQPGLERYGSTSLIGWQFGSFRE